MDANYNAYVCVFLKEYASELALLASELGVEPSDEKFTSIIRVCCSLLKVGDYDYMQYIGTLAREYFNGSFTFCDEMMDKIGYANATQVANPETTIYPEKFMKGNDFDIERYCFLLTCISEAINNLIRKQKYTDHETKKYLLNHRPIKIILCKSTTVDSSPTRVEFIMVARTLFQLVGSSCFHSAKHGAYPYVLDDGWDQKKYFFNGKQYTVKNLSEWYPEFTWEGTMKVIGGDNNKNIKPVYPANTFIIEGDYKLYECTQSSLAAQSSLAVPSSS